jgi:hypothetical protein
MYSRRLALICGLTLGDYLLWNWSLSANRDVLALLSGLTLPPLALACALLLALSFARLISHSARRSQPRIGRRRADAERNHKHQTRRASATVGALEETRRSTTTAAAPNQTPVSAPSSPPSSRKRAA